MIIDILHRLAAIPVIYNLIQILAGILFIQKRISRRLPVLKEERILLLDIGGGTGLQRRIVPNPVGYICLDVDSQKLRGFKKRYPSDVAILADGKKLPFNDESIDTTLCVSVAHHLEDQTLSELIIDSLRVLKKGGNLIILDAVWAPENFASLLLWKLDRGSFPRTMDNLRSILSTYAVVLYWESFQYIHKYFLCIATNRKD